jgi:fatty acid desaturase
VAFALKLVATIAAQQWLAWLLFVPLTFLTWLVIRPYAVHVNRCGPMTLWDAAIYLTPYKGHADHPWSQREIETKVRLVLAEALGVPLEQIRRESRLTDLIAC